MKILITILLVFVSFFVKGQESAENYFNSGAQLYAHNNIDDAIKRVNDGLSKYPSDRKLNALKSKLEEEEKKENKENNEKDNNKDKDSKEDENKDKEDQEKEDDKKDDEGKPEDEKEDKGKGDEEKKKDEKKPQPQPGQLSPQQIKSLLEAMNNQEQKVQEKMNAQKEKGIKIKTEKDW